MANGMNWLVGGGGVLFGERLPDRVIEPHHLGDGTGEIDGGLAWGVALIVIVIVIIMGLGMLIVPMTGMDCLVCDSRALSAAGCSQSNRHYNGGDSDTIRDRTRC